MADFKYFLGEHTCLNCYHPEHAEICQENDLEWLDPIVGGNPENTPRICGCSDSVNLAQRNAIIIELL
jgi:hypothetical protein